MCTGPTGCPLVPIGILVAVDTIFGGEFEDLLFNPRNLVETPTLGYLVMVVILGAFRIVILAYAYLHVF